MINRMWKRMAGSWKTSGERFTFRLLVLGVCVQLARLWSQLFTTDWPVPTAIIVVGFGLPLTVMLAVHVTRVEGGGDR